MSNTPPDQTPPDATPDDASAGDLWYLDQTSPYTSPYDVPEPGAPEPAPEPTPPVDTTWPPFGDTGPVTPSSPPPEPGTWPPGGGTGARFEPTPAGPPEPWPVGGAAGPGAPPPPSPAPEPWPQPDPTVARVRPELPPPPPWPDESGLTPDAQQYQRLIDFAMQVFDLTDEDIEEMAQALYVGRVASMQAAYEEVLAAVDAIVEGEDAAAGVEALGAQAVAAYAGAQSVAATYSSQLQQQAAQMLLQYAQEHAGSLHGAERELRPHLQRWAADRAGWKSRQVANAETGAAANAGTMDAVGDLIDGEIDLPPDVAANPGAIVIAAMPDTAAEVRCADLAGNFYPLDAAAVLPPFPLHPNCPHEWVVLYDAAGELQWDYGVGELGPWVSPKAEPVPEVLPVPEVPAPPPELPPSGLGLSDEATLRATGIEHPLTGPHERLDPAGERIAAARSLAGRLRGNADFARLGEALGADTSEATAARLLAAWGRGWQGDFLRDPLHLALQDAARAEFGLPVTFPADETLSRHAAERYGDVQDGLRAFLRAQYDETQAWFAARGITELDVFEGFAWEGADRVPAEWRDERVRWDGSLQALPMPSPIPLAPASTSLGDAFAHAHATVRGDVYRAVIGYRVPVARVLSTEFTGFGDNARDEVVLLGGARDEVWAKPLYTERPVPSMGAAYDLDELYRDFGLVGGLRGAGVELEPLAPMGFPAPSQALNDLLNPSVAAAERGERVERVETIQEVQARVGDALVGRLRGDADFGALVEDGALGATPHEAIGALLRAWDQGQGQLYRALQEAVTQVFGLAEAAAPFEGDITAGALERFAGVQPGLCAYVRAQYEATQEWLAEHGLTEVTVFRGINYRELPEGMGADLFDGVPHAAEMRLQPASSWSANDKIAEIWANRAYMQGGQPGDYRLVMAERVPAARVLSTPQTGIGSSHVNEVVVLGGRDTVSVVGVDHGYLQLPEAPEAFAPSAPSGGAPPPPEPSEGVRAWQRRFEEFEAAPSRFAPQETTEAVDAWLHGQWPHVEFDLGDLPVDVANHVGTSWTRFADQYPAVAARLRVFATDQSAWAERLRVTDRLRASYAMSDARGGSAMLLNSAWFRDPAAMEATIRAEVAFYEGQATVESVLVHEYGHLLMAYLEQAGGDEVRDQLAAMLRAFPHGRATLDAYSRISAREQWAQGFSALLTGGERARADEFVQAQRSFLSRALDHLGATPAAATEAGGAGAEFEAAKPSEATPPHPPFRAELPDETTLRASGARGNFFGENVEKDPVPGVTKVTAAHLGDNPDFRALADRLREIDPTLGKGDREIVRVLLGGYHAGVVGADASPLVAALQEAARAEFGLADAQALPGTKLLARADKLFGDVQPGLRVFLRDMYEQTQAYFRDKGIEEVTLWRGMGWTAAKKPEGIAWDGAVRVVRVPIQPFTAFSTSPEVSINYIEGRYGLLTGQTVPVERILSVPATGFGMINEQEVVVLGGHDEALGQAKVAPKGGRAYDVFTPDGVYRDFGTAGRAAEPVEVVPEAIPAPRVSVPPPHPPFRAELPDAATLRAAEADDPLFAPQGTPALAPNKADLDRHYADRLEGDPAFGRLVARLRAEAPGEIASTQDAVHALRTMYEIPSVERRDPLVIAMHQAIAQEFGLDVQAVGTAAEIKRADKLYGDVLDGLRAYFRLQYEEAQAYFRERGITELTLWRGQRWEETKPPAGIKWDGKVRRLTADMQPGSPWSTSVDRARVFTDIGRVPARTMLMGATVPVERVLSTGFTGLGVMDDREVLLLGGRDEVWAQPKRFTAFPTGSGFTYDLDEVFRDFGGLGRAAAGGPDLSAAEAETLRALAATQDQLARALKGVKENPESGQVDSATRAIAKRLKGDAAWQRLAESGLIAPEHGTLEEWYPHLTPAQRVVGRALFEWGATSAGSDLAVALQYEARDLFGMDVQLHVTDERVAAALAKFGPYEDGLRALLREQYAYTQEWLEQRGVDEVVIYRGMTWDPQHWAQRPAPEGVAWDGQAHAARVELRPLSSFTTDPGWALNFAGRDMGGPDTRHMLVVARVPRSAVFSVYATGMGTMTDREIVLLGQAKQAWTIGWRAQEAHPAEDAVLGLVARAGRSDEMLAANAVTLPVAGEEAAPAPRTGADLRAEAERLKAVLASVDVPLGDEQYEYFARVADRLADNPAWRAYADSLPLGANSPWSRDEWAVASMGRNWVAETINKYPRNVAIRLAVAEEFGLDQVPRADDAVLAEARALLAEHGAAFRAYVRAVYDETQQWFAERGITDLTVYRGRAWAEGGAPAGIAFDGQARRVATTLEVMSSVSTTPELSWGFASDLRDASFPDRMFLATRMPVADVLGTPFTSFAKRYEQEYFVLGGRREVAAIAFTEATAPASLDAALDKLAPLVATSSGEPAVEEIPTSHLPTKWSDIAKMEPIPGPTSYHEGQWYRDAQGREFYVKTAPSAAHAYNEVAAMRAYEAFGARPGVDIPFTGVVRDAKTKTSYVVSQKIDGLSIRQGDWWRSPEAAAARERAKDLWGADVLLSHWDVVGVGVPSYANLEVAADGRPVRVETGGAMAYGGAGGVKISWRPGGEFDGAWTLRGIDKDGRLGRPIAADVFGGITDREAADLLQAAAERLDLADLEARWRAAKVPAAQIKRDLAVLRDRLDRLPAVLAELRGEAASAAEATEADLLAARKAAGLDKAPTSPKETVGDVHAQQRAGLAQHAQANGLAVAAYQKAVTSRLRDLVKDATLSVRVPSDALGSILDDGRFKTAFETPRADLVDPEHYMAMRTQAERRLFGYADDLDPMLRPVYAYLSDAGTDADYVEMYGDARVVLKDEVRTRTTATFYDSISQAPQLPRPLTALRWDAYPQWEGAYTADPLHAYSLAQHADVTGSYAEVQVHGGVTAGDIARVEFAETPSATLAAKLDRAGIPWRVVAPEEAPVVVEAVAREAAIVARYAGTPDEIAAWMRQEATETSALLRGYRMEGGPPASVSPEEHAAWADEARLARLARIRTLAGRLEGNEDFAAASRALGLDRRVEAIAETSPDLTRTEYAVASLMGEWAGTVRMYEDPILVALRTAVVDEFGLGTVVEGVTSDVEAQAARLYAEGGAGLRAVARAVYDETQDWLRTNGVTDLTVYRGRSFDEAPADLFHGGGRASVPIRGITSYSTDPGEAAAFAGYGGEYRMVVSDRIPAAEVWSVGATGLGTRDEAEVLVLGAEREMVSYGWVGPDNPDSDAVVRGLAEQYAQEGRVPRYAGPGREGEAPFIHEGAPPPADVTAPGYRTAEEFHEAFADALGDGLRDEGHAVEVGALVRDYVHQRMPEVYEAARAAAVVRAKPTADLTADEIAWLRGDPEAVAAHGGLHLTEAMTAYAEALQQEVASLLQDAREVGGVDLRVAEGTKKLNETTERWVDEARALFPRDWLEASNDLGPLIPVRDLTGESGGYYLGHWTLGGGGEIAVQYTKGTSDEAFYAAATHELGHRMEQAVPRIWQLERDFYARRTTGEALVDLTNGIDEQTRLDRFADQYLGREPIAFGGFRDAAQNWESYELLSVGLEWTLGGSPAAWRMTLDPEYQAFVLGVLFGVRADALPATVEGVEALGREAAAAEETRRAAAAAAGEAADEGRPVLAARGGTPWEPPLVPPTVQWDDLRPTSRRDFGEGVTQTFRMRGKDDKYYFIKVPEDQWEVFAEIRAQEAYRIVGLGDRLIPVQGPYALFTPHGAANIWPFVGQRQVYDVGAGSMDLPAISAYVRGQLTEREMWTHNLLSYALGDFDRHLGNYVALEIPYTSPAAQYGGRLMAIDFGRAFSTTMGADDWQNFTELPRYWYGATSGAVDTPEDMATLAIPREAIAAITDHADDLLALVPDQLVSAHQTAEMELYVDLRLQVLRRLGTLPDPTYGDLARLDREVALWYQETGDFPDASVTDQELADLAANATYQGGGGAIRLVPPAP